MNRRLVEQALEIVQSLEDRVDHMEEYGFVDHDVLSSELSRANARLSLALEEESNDLKEEVGQLLESAGVPNCS